MAEDAYIRFLDASDNCIKALEGESMDDVYKGTDGWIPVSNFKFGFGWGGSEASSSGGKDGQLKPEPFTFSKRLDKATVGILNRLSQKQGEVDIFGAEVIVCRYGGEGTKSKDIKIPFVRLKFSGVRLTQSGMSVSTDPNLEEQAEFSIEHGKVLLESICTDNASGTRVPGGTLRAGFNFAKQSDKMVFERGG